MLAGSQKSLAREDRGGLDALTTGDPVETLTALADLAAPPAQFEGGAAGLFDSIGDAIGGIGDKIQAGAREALRAAAYWKMKQRAGVVGTKGLAPILGEIVKASPGVRIHLIGHSFGARVVSFALDSVDGTWEGENSPIKSLLLLQGAFSKWAFDADLEFDPGRAGALSGRQNRVDGPLMVTHTMKDSAVGKMYPLASMLGHQDAGHRPILADTGARFQPGCRRPMGSSGRSSAPNCPLNGAGSTPLVRDLLRSLVAVLGHEVNQRPTARPACTGSADSDAAAFGRE